MRQITTVTLIADGVPVTFLGLGATTDCAREDWVFENGVWIKHNYAAYFEFGPLEPGAYTIRTIHSNSQPHYWTEWCVITVE